MKHAHAVYDPRRREIFANSVHDTAQGAMVNGLLLCFGFITPQHFTYEQVKNVWQHKAGHQFLIVKVSLVTSGQQVKL